MAEGGEGKQDEAIDRLIRAVLAVQEGPMRRARTARLLSALDPRRAIDVLEVVHHLAGSGSERARGFLLSLGTLADLAPHLPAGRLRSWERALKERDHDLARALLARRPRLVTYAEHAQDINEYLDDVPLGRRKTLARSRDRRVIERIRFDKHPSVVQMLLDNAKVVETDVVFMAALRPTSQGALVTIARHPRWSKRYRVRSALCHNPYTPPPVVAGLLPGLMLPELRAIARDRKINEDLRRQAQGILARRRVRVRLPRASQTSHTAVTQSTHTLEAEERDLAGALLEAMALPEPGRAPDPEPPEPPSPGEGSDLVDEGLQAEAEAFLESLGTQPAEPVAFDTPAGEDGPRDERGARRPPLAPPIPSTEARQVAEAYLSSLDELRPVPLVSQVRGGGPILSMAPQRPAPVPQLLSDARSLKIEAIEDRTELPPALMHPPRRPRTRRRPPEAPLPTPPMAPQARGRAPQAEEDSEEVEAVALEFLNNLGPLTLTPVAVEDDEEDAH